MNNQRFVLSVLTSVSFHTLLKELANTYENKEYAKVIMISQAIGLIGVAKEANKTVEEVLEDIYNKLP